METIYDTIIVGGGPAGAAAAVYAGRKKLKTLLIAESLGGQSLNSNDIENWIGTIHLTGYELAQKLEEHIRTQEAVDVKLSERVEKISKEETVSLQFPFWIVQTNKETYKTKTVIVVSGGRRKKLNVPGEDTFAGRGVVYCSTCDSPLFKGKNVVIVGGGNAALEGVIDSLPYAHEIYLLIRGTEMKGDPVTVEHVLNAKDKVTIIYQGVTQEILGNSVVTGLRYLDKITGETKELTVDGVFIEVGSLPNSEFIKGLVELNEKDEILINHKTGETSQEGIYAAGDVTDAPFKQNNISSGDAIKAALSAYSYVLCFK